MTWPEKFWIMTALWAVEGSATFYWRRRCRRLEERVEKSWLNLMSPLSTREHRRGK